LATDKVRYVGEAIAACVAPTRVEAEDLAASVTVNYEVLDSVVDPLRNMRRASMRSCWHAKNSNVAGSRSLIPLSSGAASGAL
jgi:CO/xanthine dehydrogenase Mo-binding subunit